MADYLAPVHDICNVFFAESPVDGTHLETKACALPQPRKYRTGLLRNAGHNCSSERSTVSVQGFHAGNRETRGSGPRLCKSAQSLFVPRENNRHSPRILHGSERCGNTVGSLYGMVVVRAEFRWPPAGARHNPRNPAQTHSKCLATK